MMLVKTNFFLIFILQMHVVVISFIDNEQAYCGKYIIFYLRPITLEVDVIWVSVSSVIH